MAIYELTLTATYVPDWGLSEGFRELVANGLDAEHELNAPLTVEYRKERRLIVVTNAGAVLDRKALLFGYTTKTGRADTIGRFGEGLKLGMLACVRAGYPVKVRTGGDVWKPFLKTSPKFGVQVLAVDVKANAGGLRSEVVVEIGNVDLETWEALRPMFMFLGGPAADDVVTIDGYGDLILDPAYRGKVFVKGVFVQFSDRFQYGYNLSSASVDRDRRIVYGFDLEWRTRSMNYDAIARRPDLVPGFVKGLDDGTEDAVVTDSDHAGYAPQGAIDAVVANFRERFGAKAFPCTSTAQTREVEYHGRAGVVVPKALYLMLSRSLGTVEALLDAGKTQVMKTFAWSELTDLHRANLTDAVGLVEAEVPPVTLAIVDVVDFRDPSIVGQFLDGKILIARSMLDDFAQTLATVVHEAGHFAGPDKSRGHDEARDVLWSQIVVRMLRRLRAFDAN